ncbi:MAG: type II toxin-antitoxin system RelE/ParE family toxin [Rhizobiales bacterium]|nr:type II toxin-antitoxin system RelE/ParE family toxin [Hyphomicrobiales bacterium]
MKQKELIITATAREDLTEIFLYIAEESIEVAIEFVEDIHSKIEWIVSVDFTGSPRDHVCKGLRAFPYRKRCIYYYSHKDRIVVTRVLHGSQDISLKEFNEK